MKSQIIVLFAVAIGLLFTAVACNSGISQAVFDAVVSERDTARASAANFEAQLSSAAADIATLQGDLDSSTQENTRQETNIAALQGDLDSLTKDKTQLEQNNQELTASITTLQGDLDSSTQENTRKEQQLGDAATLLQTSEQANQTLQESLSAAEESLSAAEESLQTLESKFPPGRFPSLETLEAWLAEDDISERPIEEFVDGWFAKALELQQRAIEDGYLIGADFWEFDDGTFTVWNSVVLENGNYYTWDPETDELFLELNVNAF